MLLKDIKILLKKRKQRARIWGIQNLSKGEKQKLVKYRKRYYEMQKIKGGFKLCIHLNECKN